MYDSWLQWTTLIVFVVFVVTESATSLAIQLIVIAYLILNVILFKLLHTLVESKLSLDKIHFSFKYDVELPISFLSSFFLCRLS